MLQHRSKAVQKKLKFIAINFNYIQDLINHDVLIL